MIQAPSTSVTVYIMNRVNHVFSLQCKLEFDEMVPMSASVLFRDSNVYAPCLTGDACFFPLGWVFGLMRAITKLCKAVEGNDDGMIPIAVFEIHKDSSACYATVRTKASSLAVRFSTIFLKDFAGWNDVADYPKELPGRSVSYSGLTRLLSNGVGKHVCSAVLPAILNATSANVGAAEKRFWWTLVDRFEKMIFLTTLSAIRDTHELKRRASSSWEACILTALRQEETKVLRSDDELMIWNKINKVCRVNVCSGRDTQVVSCRREITECVTRSTKDDVKTMVSGEPLSPGTGTEPSMSESSLSPSTKPHAPPLEDHIRLRACNFPPRKRLAYTAPDYIVKWDNRIPCLSGIVCRPVILQDMRVNASANWFSSIW